MNKKLFRIGLGLLALAATVWPSRAAVTGLKTLSGHLPAVVSHLAATGRLAADTNLCLSIGLPLRNLEALTNLVHDLYDPFSPNYHHFLTPDEFASTFGPTPDDYQAVLDFAGSNNLSVVHAHGNRTVLTVSGKVSDIERAFHVKMMTYHHPVESRDFYAPDTEPTVNSNLPVLTVQGINNYVLPHALLLKRPSGLAQPSRGSGPQGGYMGQDFRNAYVPGGSENGSGQMVGLLQFDGYLPQDIQTYEGIAGLTNVPLYNVLLDGFNGVPGPNNDEVCLDIEMSISMAPALAGVVVFEAGPYGNPDDILSSMVSSNQIKQFSASWGYGIDATSEQLYLQLAVQGQTFLNASGDGDAWLGAIPYGSCEDPNITIIGGTTLTMHGLGASYASEQAWNWGYAGGYGWNPDGYVGTSGGVSTDVSIPYYQLGINMVTNQGSTTYRNVPDVALTADNVFVVSSGGSEGIFGGTSCASPLWAGFMALINQQATASGGSSIGFLAPQVYSLAQTPNYAVCFHDTVVGSNTWGQSTTKFFAVPGYDLCTGLGTPNGTNLITALAGTGSLQTGPVVIPAPKQPWGTNLSVMDGANPNGLWLLFMQDDTINNYSGTNYNGWFVTLTTADPVGYNGDNQMYINATNIFIAPGGTWTTILAVTNYGPSVSSNVYVTDVIPLPGISLVSSNSSIPGSTITIFGNTLTWTAGNLPVNAGGTLTLNYLANSAGQYTNTASVAASTTDPNPDDDSVSVVATVVAPTPPSLAAYFIPGPGGSFQLTITNNPGTTNIIQASTNLLTWLPVFTNIVPFTFTNFDNTNFAHRFYRAVSSP